MESELVDTEAALKALAVLSTIPIVIFALWADSFEKYIQRRLIEKPSADTPKFEPHIEIEKIRTASLCVILFQFSLFIGSFETRNDHPALSQLVFCVAILIQLWLQSKIEKTVNSKNKVSDDLAGLVVKALLSWLAGAFLYVVSVSGLIAGAVWTVDTLHLSKNVGAALFFVSGITGIMAGLAINFILAPIFLKRILPIQPLVDEPLQAELENQFKEARLPVPKFWVIEFKQIRMVNVILAGFQKGRGSLSPALMIARHLFGLLSPAELKAMITHQVSHMALKHFRKKFVLSFSLIFLTTFIALFMTVLSNLYWSDHPLAQIMGPGCALISFLASLQLMTQQMKDHQFQADIYSIEHLGVAIEDFCSYLRKLDNPIGTPAAIQLGLPLTEKRITRVIEFFATRKISRPPASKESQIRPENEKKDEMASQSKAS